ncbi:N-acetylmannosamine-6-phosphate 2-epimerase, partial [Staphylococcus aureus]
MLPHGLIVSCQALPDEPLHSSFIMSKMALAAYEGGAVGIRANTKEDILAIKETVDLPVIGIVKRDYDHSDVFITATSKEVDELIESQCEVIALDATLQQRPKETLDELVT